LADFPNGDNQYITASFLWCQAPYAIWTLPAGSVRWSAPRCCCLPCPYPAGARYTAWTAG